MQVRIFKQDPQAEGGFAEAGRMPFSCWLEAHPEFSAPSLEVIATQLNNRLEVCGTNPATGEPFKLIREG